MNKKDTVLIIYRPGEYGTFIEWCLDYFSGELDSEVLPFMENGSSHLYGGNPLNWSTDLLPNAKEITKIQPITELLTIDEYLTSNLNWNFARTHPSKAVNKEILNYFKKIIIVEVDIVNLLEVYLNYYTKVKDSKKVLKHWLQPYGLTEVSCLTEIKYALVNLFQNSAHLEINNHNHIIKINLKDLTNDLHSSLLYLFNELELGLDKTRATNIDKIFNQWKSTQRFLGLGGKCIELVESISNNSYIEIAEQHLLIDSFIIFLVERIYKLGTVELTQDCILTDTINLKKCLKVKTQS